QGRAAGRCEGRILEGLPNLHSESTQPSGGFRRSKVEPLGSRPIGPVPSGSLSRSASRLSSIALLNEIDPAARELGCFGPAMLSQPSRRLPDEAAGSSD